MAGIIGIGSGDAGKQVLIRFTGQQIAVVERVLAEIGEQGIARAIDGDREFPRHDFVRRALGRLGHGGVQGVRAGGRRLGGRHNGIERQQIAAAVVRAVAAHVPKLAHHFTPENIPPGHALSEPDSIG